MTHEEAIEEIKQVRFNLNCQLNGTSRFEEAFEMAIKALEQQTCVDAVSREAAVEAIANTNVNGESLGYAVAYDILCDLPSVNPQPKTGHWIDCGSYYRCSECDNWVDEVNGMPKFCDECGAKMVEPQESEGVYAESNN